jgi:hypothetical protein
MYAVMRPPIIVGFFPSNYIVYAFFLKSSREIMHERDNNVASASDEFKHVRSFPSRIEVTF